MDVIHVDPVFLFALDLMFPEASLPDGRFSMFAPGFAHPGINMKQLLAALGKTGFYPIPAQGKISVIGWQGPHAMEVIREQHPGINGKWIPGSGFPDHIPKDSSSFRGVEQMPASECHHGKKIGTTCGIGTTIFGHCACVGALFPFNIERTFSCSCNGVPFTGGQANSRLHHPTLSGKILPRRVGTVVSCPP